MMSTNVAPFADVFSSCRLLSARPGLLSVEGLANELLDGDAAALSGVAERNLSSAALTSCAKNCSCCQRGLHVCTRMPGTWKLWGRNLICGFLRPWAL